MLFSSWVLIHFGLAETRKWSCLGTVLMPIKGSNTWLLLSPGTNNWKGQTMKKWICFPHRLRHFLWRTGGQHGIHELVPGRTSEGNELNLFTEYWSGKHLLHPSDAISIKSDFWGWYRGYLMKFLRMEIFEARETIFLGILTLCLPHAFSVPTMMILLWIVL